MSSSPVLISWIAINNDPYERNPGAPEGEPIPGPTLTILFDEESEFARRIRDVVLFHRQSEGPRGEHEREVVERTQALLQQREVKVQLEPWTGDDPTDHRQIFEFLRERLPVLRQRFEGRQLVIHVSPGTPSMQTIWVLMAETGFVGAPFVLVKSLRKSERRGRPAVLPVQLGIETFYKAYMAARPRQLASQEQAVVWDPAKFRSDRMGRLFAEARRFASLNVPILLLGERGTGKTTLASWIRQHSPFRRDSQDHSWPAVACGQYSPETMRSELFGHAKGAFTGATQAKPGLLDAANGDTLFLDEVGDVSRDVQRLLIKALEEKVYLPLGAQQSRASDFRLLSATNLEPGELESRLDPDFLDRISPVRLRMPALREVREELPWLWATVHTATAKRAGVGEPPALETSERDRLVSALSSHALPGNMRDLFRVAYRLLAARSDVHEPLGAAEAVDYALEGLKSGSQTTPPRAIARAFADATPLDAIIDEHGSVATDELDHELKHYLGTELRRISEARERPIDTLCDKSERSIRDWASLRKKPAKPRK